jgi:hypothetical protein
LGAVDFSAWAIERMIEKIDAVYAWLAGETRERAPGVMSLHI